MVRVVRSDASTVEEYIADAPAERRDALELLRQLCREELNGFDEEMAYGMPSYLRDGVAEVGFASQKAYISLYILRRDAFDAGTERLAGLSLGKGCVRFARPEQVDPVLVRDLLKAAATDSGPLC
jgi:uncharacterized protein YdhG (YjbR/CyaY superfamily)